MGAALAARQRRIPALLDGFVCTAAVAPLAKLRRDALDHTLAAHVAAEAAHRMLLSELELAPLLDLGMRLGEGSGAALAVPVLRAAPACANVAMPVWQASAAGGQAQPLRAIAWKNVPLTHPRLPPSRPIGCP